MNTRVQSLFTDFLDEYNNFNQNDLINESKVIRFAKDRGIAVSGVVTGDPSKFVELGWITPDSANGFFHPFRIYPCLKAIQLCELRVAATSSINRDSFRDFLSLVSEFLPSLESIATEVQLADQISNLAILLEPVYWPKITNKTKMSIPNYSTIEEFDLKIKPYKERILAFVKSLDIETWSSYHEHLRIEADRLDDNHELYMLLRLAPWGKRERITGNIGGALWLRHIAEIIRLAFEEVHGVKWREEYEAFGFWYEGARTKLYGSERPIENGLITRPHLAFEFGLHTGSTVRWYVEGETEYQAALYALPNACLGGIEIINLKGVFKENANAPMRLVDHLKNDKELRRFSFISFDGDRADNIRFVKKNIELENIVGCVNINRPDFEFENFTVNELIKIAIKFDKTLGYDSKNLMSENKENIDSGGAFDNFYRKYSARGTSLKGKGWGEALAEYSLDNPLKEDTQQRRTFLQTIDQILHASRVRYDYQSENFAIDPDDFQIKEKDSFI